MSRTIVNISDDQNSWTTDQSTGSTSTSTTIRDISGVSDGLNSWDIDQSTGTTNSTTTIRYINGEVLEMLSILKARATYYENHVESESILRTIQNITL